MGFQLSLLAASDSAPLYPLLTKARRQLRAISSATQAGHRPPFDFDHDVIVDLASLPDLDPKRTRHLHEVRWEPA